MRVSLIILLAALITLAACDKNKVSKIPHISLTTFGPDSVYLSAGTHDSIAYMEFSFVDGDGDIGVDSSRSAIFIKDNRYDSAGFIKHPFPSTIDGSIEDPKKGLTGTVQYWFVLDQALTIRPDSVHQVLGDTTTFEVYITDRERNESNHFTTPRLIIRP